MVSHFQKLRIYALLRTQEPRASMLDPVGQIPPLRIVLFDQFELPRPFPFFHTQLALSRIVKVFVPFKPHQDFAVRSEEHTSELQSLMRISYAVFCLNK